MEIVLSANIKKDRTLAEKIAANDLNCIDCFELAAAVKLSELFSSMPIYILPQQQTKPIKQIPRLYSCAQPISTEKKDLTANTNIKLV